MDPAAVTEATRRWIDTIVIGLNLCPFAQRVFHGDLIRYAVSAANDETELLQDLERELQALVAAPIESIETTLLIHPHALADFLDFNDFLDAAESLLKRPGPRRRHPDRQLPSALSIRRNGRGCY